MILSNVDIQQELDSTESETRLRINPEPEVIQPASVDVHLGSHYRWFNRTFGTGVLDPLKDDAKDHMSEGEGDTYLLKPGRFVLATTIESFVFPPWIVGRLEGKSSLARLGLVVHVTAGFFDPGFSGEATLEVVNLNDEWAIRLHAGMPIAQMSFAYLNSTTTVPYGSPGLNSKYVEQSGATASKYRRNFDA